MGITYTQITFRLVDAELTDGDWPACCVPDDRHRGGIRQHLREIPTHLTITDCNADWTERATRWLIVNKLDRN